MNDKNIKTAILEKDLKVCTFVSARESEHHKYPTFHLGYATKDEKTYKELCEALMDEDILKQCNKSFGTNYSSVKELIDSDDIFPIIYCEVNNLNKASEVGFELVSTFESSCPYYSFPCKISEDQLELFETALENYRVAVQTEQDLKENHAKYLRNVFPEDLRAFNSANDINGNSVIKAFYKNGDTEIIRGGRVLDFYERYNVSHFDRNKFYGSETGLRKSKIKSDKEYDE